MHSGTECVLMSYCVWPEFVCQSLTEFDVLIVHEVCQANLIMVCINLLSPDYMKANLKLLIILETTYCVTQYINVLKFLTFT
jgi:hypothetical protein